MVPYLAEAIPTVENGGVSADLTVDHLEAEGRAGLVGRHAGDRRGRGLHLGVLHPSRRRLRPDLRTSTTSTDVEAVDPKTVKVTFGVAKPYPYGPFVGAQSPIIQKAQFADCLGAKAPTCTEANTKPIGTGPFRVTDFKANDVVTLEANPNFRDPAKPAFANVVLKGGGDAGRGGALGAGDRRVRLRLERPGRARDPRADGGGRKGRGDLRLRHAGRAPARQPDRPRPGARRRAVDRGAPAPVPDRHQRGQGAQPRHRPRDPGRDRLRRGRAGHLQHGAGAGDQRLDQQRLVQEAGHGAGQEAARRGRLDRWAATASARRTAGGSRSSTRPRPTRCARRRRR